MPTAIINPYAPPAYLRQVAPQAEAVPELLTTAAERFFKDGKITDHWNRNDFMQVVQGL